MYLFLLLFLHVNKLLRIFCVQAITGPQQLDNPPSGTIVDHTVTRRDW